jgi:hypothetical protein
MTAHAPASLPTVSLFLQSMMCGACTSFFFNLQSMQNVEKLQKMTPNTTTSHDLAPTSHAF